MGRLGGARLPAHLPGEDDDCQGFDPDPRSIRSKTLMQGVDLLRPSVC